MFPSDNYNHFPRYQGKFSGEEIDDLLSTVKTWKGGTNTGTGSLVFANPSVRSLQDWWSATLSTTGVSESDGTKAISGPALINWWNGKYISNIAISWDTITADMVPSKGLIDVQLNTIRDQLSTRAPKKMSYTYTSLAASNNAMPASVYRWAFSDKDNTWVSNSESYTEPVTKISLILAMPSAEIAEGSPVRNTQNLLDMGVFFSGADQNPFIWCHSDTQRVPAEWTIIGRNPSSPFCSMDATVPKIYLTPGDDESVNSQLSLSCFNFADKITLEDGQITLYVYEGTCFSTGMLNTLRGESNPGNSLLEAIHSAYTGSGQDMKKSYVIFEVRLDTINVYWNLVAAI